MSGATWQPTTDSLSKTESEPDNEFDTAPGGVGGFGATAAPGGFGATAAPGGFGATAAPGGFGATAAPGRFAFGATAAPGGFGATAAPGGLGNTRSAWAPVLSGLEPFESVDANAQEPCGTIHSDPVEGAPEQSDGNVPAEGSPQQRGGFMFRAAVATAPLPANPVLLDSTPHWKSSRWNDEELNVDGWGGGKRRTKNSQKKQPRSATTASAPQERIQVVQTTNMQTCFDQLTLPLLVIKRRGAASTLGGEHRSMFGCVAALQEYCYTKHDCDGRVPPLWPQLWRTCSTAMPTSGWLHKVIERCPIVKEAFVTDELPFLVQRHAPTLTKLKLSPSGSARNPGALREHLAQCSQLTWLSLGVLLGLNCLVNGDTTAVPHLTHLTLNDDDNVHLYAHLISAVWNGCPHLVSFELLRGRHAGRRGVVMPTLLNSLPADCKLTSLSMPHQHHDYLPTDDWVAFSRCKHLTALDLSYACVRPEMAAKSMSHLCGFAKLRSLHLANFVHWQSFENPELFVTNSMRGDLSDAFGRVLHDSPMLEDIEVTCKLSLLHSLSAIEALAGLSMLRSLRIAEVGLGEPGQDPSAVFRALAKCVCLRDLVVDSNNLSHAGAGIASFLCDARSLRRLSLSTTKLTDEDFVDIFDPLLRAPSLETVDLSGNGCGRQGIEALHAALHERSTAAQPQQPLRRLDLRRNEAIDDAGLAECIALLNATALIDALVLSECSVTRGGLKAALLNVGTGDAITVDTGLVL